MGAEHAVMAAVFIGIPAVAMGGALYFILSQFNAFKTLPLWKRLLAIPAPIAFIFVAELLKMKTQKPQLASSIQQPEDVGLQMHAAEVGKKGVGSTS